MFDSVVIVTKVGYTDQHNMINSSTDGCISSEKFLMCQGQYMVYEVCSSYRKVGFLFIKETKITPCLWGG